MNKQTVKEIWGLNEEVIVLPNGAQVVVEKFISLFSETSNNPSYQELVDVDGGRMGYIPFFNDLKEQGILN